MLNLELQCQPSELTASLSAKEGKLATSHIDCDWEQLCQIGSTLQRILARGWQHNGGNEQDECEFRAAAKQLGDVLFTDALPSALAAHSEQSLLLHLSPNALAIPWESALWNGQFLSDRFSIGRQLSDSQSVDARRPLPEDACRVRIWANPTLDLIHAEREADAIQRTLINTHSGLTNIEPHGIHHAMTQAQFFHELSLADVFHFAGHTRVQNTTRTWQFEDGHLTPKDVVDSNTRMPRFLFAHACASAQINATNAIDNLPIAFLRKGVENFLGLWTPILDHHAIAFANAFYTQLAHGHSIGDSIRFTRRTLRATDGWSSVLCGNYVLYGDPSLSIGLPPSSERNKPAHSVSTLNSPTPPSDARSLNYPIECESCGRTIKSHFMVASFTHHSNATHAVCRACHADRKASHSKSVERADGAPRLDNHHRSVAATPGSAVVSTLTARTTRLSIPSSNPLPASTPAPPPAWSRLLTGLMKPHAFLDSASGEKRNLRWDETQAFNGRSARYRLVSCSREREPASLDWELTCILTDSLGIMQPHPSDKPSDPAIPDTQCPRWVAEPWLQREWSAITGPTNAQRSFLVLACTQGWSEHDSDRIVDSLPLQSPVDAPTVILVDLSSHRLHCSRTDFDSKQVVQCLDWESDSHRTARIVDFLVQQRPLAVSLSAESVSSTLAVPMDAVLHAFRFLIATEKMHLDRVEPFGWILSEAHT